MSKLVLDEYFSALAASDHSRNAGPNKNRLDGVLLNPSKRLVWTVIRRLPAHILNDGTFTWTLIGKNGNDNDNPSIYLF